MSMANTSAISMTNSESPSQVFATLRFAGDALDPDEISRVVRRQPTRAYRKDQRYQPGPGSPDITGKTGVWYFSTKRNVPGKNLRDHLDALVSLVLPFADDDKRLRELRDIMERRNLQAHGRASGAGPSVLITLYPRCGEWSAGSVASGYRGGFRKPAPLNLDHLVVRTRHLIPGLNHRDCFASPAMTPQKAVIPRSGATKQSRREAR